MSPRSGPGRSADGRSRARRKSLAVLLLAVAVAAVSALATAPSASATKFPGNSGEPLHDLRVATDKFIDQWYETKDATMYLAHSETEGWSQGCLENEQIADPLERSIGWGYLKGYAQETLSHLTQVRGEIAKLKKLRKKIDGAADDLHHNRARKAHKGARFLGEALNHLKEAVVEDEAANNAVLQEDCGEAVARKDAADFALTRVSVPFDLGFKLLQEAASWDWPEPPEEAP